MLLFFYVFVVVLVKRKQERFLSLILLLSSVLLLFVLLKKNRRKISQWKIVSFQCCELEVANKVVPFVVDSTKIEFGQRQHDNFVRSNVAKRVRQVLKDFVKSC